MFEAISIRRQDRQDQEVKWQDANDNSIPYLCTDRADCFGMSDLISESCIRIEVGYKVYERDDRASSVVLWACVDRAEICSCSDTRGQCANTHDGEVIDSWQRDAACSGTYEARSPW